MRETLIRNRHRSVREQGRWLRRMIQGHYNYYGVSGNRKALEAFRTQIGHACCAHCADGAKKEEV